MHEDIAAALRAVAETLREEAVREATKRGGSTAPRAMLALSHAAGQVTALADLLSGAPA